MGPGRERESQPLSVVAEILVAVRELVVPRDVDAPTARAYYLRSLRNGSWRLLDPFQRALLRLCSKVCRAVRSRVLAGVLRHLFALIELHSTRGRALYYGMLTLLRRGLSPLEALSRGYVELLYLGISYMNNVPAFRLLG